MPTKAVPFFSQPYPYAAGAPLPINLGFLDAARKFAAPVIERVWVVFNYNVNTGAAGTNGPSKALAQVLTKIQLADVAGDRCNVRGSSLRVINQVEHGDSFSDGANLGASQNNVTGQYVWDIPFTPQKGKRRNDYGLPLYEFVDGGQLVINVSGAATLGAATEITAINAGSNFQLFFWVRDEDQRELKSRITWMDYLITQVENIYPVNGSLRWAQAYAGEVAESAASAWAAQNITCRNLDLAAVPSWALRKQYQFESRPRIGDPKGLQGATVVSEDVVVAGYSIPVCSPRMDQKISEMPQMAGLHYKTDLGSITGTNIPMMIISSVTDRSEIAAMKTLGQGSPQALAQNLRSRGVVTGHGGQPARPAATTPTRLLSRTPVSLMQRPINTATK